MYFIKTVLVIESYHFVLDEKPDGVSGAARGHVRGVAQEDGAVVLPADELVLLVRIVLLVLGQWFFALSDLP